MIHPHCISEWISILQLKLFIPLSVLYLCGGPILAKLPISERNVKIRDMCEMPLKRYQFSRGDRATDI